MALGLEESAVDDTLSTTVGILAPGIDRDSIIFRVGDLEVDASTVRSAMVIGCPVPFILIAQVSVDSFGVNDLVEDDQLVVEAFANNLEFDGFPADGLEIDSLNGHGVVIAGG